MLERLFGKRQQPEVKPLKDPSNNEDYNIQAGHAYVILGGKTEDIRTTCESCGAGFKGPCQSGCEYCSSQRKVFYADITNADFRSIPTTEKVEEMSFLIPEGDSAEFDDSTSVDMVIADEVIVGMDFDSKLVVTKKFTGGLNTQISTLILVDDGSAEIDDDSWIGNLITGKKVSVKFGCDCSVDNLLKTSSLKYKADQGFNIGKTQIISPANFIQTISEALQNK